jgi:hypothetical protein
MRIGLRATTTSSPSAVPCSFTARPMRANVPARWRRTRCSNVSRPTRAWSSSRSHAATAESASARGNRTSTGYDRLPPGRTCVVGLMAD